MSNTTTFSLYVTKDLLARIDQAAQRNHVSRTEYVLSWLPETYEPTPHADSTTPLNGTTQAHR